MRIFYYVRVELIFKMHIQMLCYFDSNLFKTRRIWHVAQMDNKNQVHVWFLENKNIIWEYMLILHDDTSFTELENEFDSCWNSLKRLQSFMALIFEN